jgi:hypothetical protein
MVRVFDVLSSNHRVRIIATGIVTVLIVASIGGLWYSSTPAEAQETTVTRYVHRGQFNYIAYVTPGVLYSDDFELPDPSTPDSRATADESEEDQLPVFFRELLQGFDVAFTLDVECSEPLRVVRTEATVTVSAEHPRMWRREMREWPESNDSNQIRIAFPLDYELLEDAVERIEDDIGIARSQSDFVMQARVRTVGETLAGEPFDEEYLHSVRAILKEKTLELDGDLKLSVDHAVGDAILTLDGRFDYEAYMGYSSLYDSDVLRSEPLPVANPNGPYGPTVQPPVVSEIGPGQVLYPLTIDSIEATFAYDFACDRRVEHVSHDLEVVATLSNADLWSKQLTLVAPMALQTGTVSFPIDVAYYDRLVAAIGEQTGIRTGTYDITIEARVNTYARTADGVIDELYTQTLAGSRSGAQLTFSETLTSTQSGTIPCGAPVIVDDRTALQPVSLFGVSAGIVGLAFVSAAWVRGGRRDEVARALARARKQYREFLVEVNELPPATQDDTTVAIRTLDDLARVAEQAGKPMLCHSAAPTPVFCVLDGRVRYVCSVR